MDALVETLAWCSKHFLRGNATWIRDPCLALSGCLVWLFWVVWLVVWYVLCVPYGRCFVASLDARVGNAAGLPPGSDGSDSAPGISCSLLL